MINPLPLAIAELRRHLLGVAVIVLMIAVAVAFGIAVSASERALRVASARAADRFDIVIGAPGSSAQLILTTVYLQSAVIPLLADDILPRLQQDKGIDYAAPIALGDYVGSSPVVGTTKDFVTDGARIELVEGRVFAKRSEAVVGSATMLAIGERFRPAHGGAEAQLIDPHKHGFEFSVVGRLPKTGTAWDNAILVPIEAIWGIHTGALSGFNNEHNQPLANAQETLGPPWSSENIKGVPAIVVRVKSPADAYRLHALYQYRSGDNKKTDAHSATMAVFPAEVLVQLYSVIGDARKIMTAMSLATQCVVLLAVLLVIISALAARRQSLAVLRAMGAPTTFIFALIWLQAVVLIGLGTALGMVFGWVGSMILVNVFVNEAGFSITPTIGFTEWLLAASVVAAGSVLAVIPSVMAWRQNIAKSLR